MSAKSIPGWPGMGLPLFELENDRVLVFRFDGVYSLVHRILFQYFRWSLLLGHFPALAEEFQFSLLHLTPNRENHGIRIERRAVMEFDSLSQIEGVGEPVRADLP